MTISNSGGFGDDLAAAPASVGGTTDATSGGSGGKADAAKGEAKQVASTAAGAGQHVAETARDEASRVASETKSQARDLYHQTRSELTEQAASQQRRVASGLRSVSQELDGMASRSDQSGMGTELVGQAASRLEGVASWLDQRDPGSLLDEVKQFAARRPGVFIGAAAVAGLLAGRLTRGIAAAVSDEKEADSTTSPKTSAEPAVPAAETSTFSTPASSTLDRDANVPAYDVNSGVAPTQTPLGGSEYR